MTLLRQGHLSGEPHAAVQTSGGMSRAAKGGDCKSPGYAFVGSSPTSPTTLFRSPGRACEKILAPFKFLCGRRRDVRRKALCSGGFRRAQDARLGGMRGGAHRSYRGPHYRSSGSAACGRRRRHLAEIRTIQPGGNHVRLCAATLPKLVFPAALLVPDGAALAAAGAA